MNKRIVFSSCAAAILSMSAAAAQTTTQTPTQSPVQGSTQGTTGQTRVGTGTQASATPMTVTGCIVLESEHTKARGGVLGTGVGAANEFVIASVAPARGASTASEQIAGSVSGSTSAGADRPAGGNPIGTSGTASASAGSNAPAAAAYALTGSREADLEQYVGKRVEIVGTVDNANTAAAGAGAAGASPGAAASSQGADAAKLPQMTVVSFKAVEGNCK